MSGRGMLDMFAGHACLQNLGERHLMTLASGARSFEAKPDEFLGREGQPAQHFYLVQSGIVALESSSPGHPAVPVQMVGPGEVVGWSWLVEPHRWQFDARAVGTVRAISFNAEWLRDQCAQDHELGYQLLKALIGVLADRLGNALSSNV